MNQIFKIIAVPVLVVSLLLGTIGTAFADAKRDIECSLVLALGPGSSPGVDTVKVKKNHSVIKNTGQRLVGTLDCFDSATGNPVPEVSGTVMTDHSSKVKFDGGFGDIGSFKGKLKGDLFLDTDGDMVPDLTGKMKANVDGTGMLVPLGSAPEPFDTIALFADTENINGKAKLKGMNLKIKGEFDISLLFPGVFGGTLDGSIHSH